MGIYKLVLSSAIEFKVNFRCELICADFARQGSCGAIDLPTVRRPPPLEIGVNYLQQISVRWRRDPAIDAVWS